MVTCRNEVLEDKNSLSTTSFTTSLTQTGLGSKSDLRGKLQFIFLYCYTEWYK